MIVYCARNRHKAISGHNFRDTQCTKYKNANKQETLVQTWNIFKWQGLEHLILNSDLRGLRKLGEKLTRTARSANERESKVSELSIPEKV